MRCHLFIYFYVGCAKPKPLIAYPSSIAACLVQGAHLHGRLLPMSRMRVARCRVGHAESSPTFIMACHDGMACEDKRWTVPVFVKILFFSLG